MENSDEATNHEVELDIGGNALDKTVNQEVGATYVENFMREVANLQGASKIKPLARPMMMMQTPTIHRRNRTEVLPYRAANC